MNVAQVAQLNPSLLLPHLLPAAAASGAASALLNPAMAQLPNTQASRQARRLYVGNIPPSVTDVSHIAIRCFVDSNHSATTKRTYHNVITSNGQQLLPYILV